MFKKLLNKFFKKSKNTNTNVYYFEDSKKAFIPEQKTENEQPVIIKKEIVFHSFEEEYQRDFYDYLLGKSHEGNSSSSDELTCFITEKIETLFRNPKFILDSLPVLPLSLSKIIEQLNNKDFETDALIQLIQQEPAIAAKVIELANSTYYNRYNKEITDLKSAYMLLGVNGLLEGVINGFVNKLVPKSNIYFRQYGQKIWQHSLSTGITAKAIVAKSAFKSSSAQAYFIGLICNLGDLIIYQLLIDAFAVVHPDCQPNSTLFKDIMAKESKKLTYFIAKYWNFPDSILEVLALQVKVKRAALLPALYKKMPLACYVYEAKIISELASRISQSAIEDDYIEEVSTSLLFTTEANNQLKKLLAEQLVEKA
ncbi:MAG: HDOD domain-containing protein [Cognaticolwellia sp.]